MTIVAISNAAKLNWPRPRSVLNGRTIAQKVTPGHRKNIPNTKLMTTQLTIFWRKTVAMTLEVTARQAQPATS